MENLRFCEFYVLTSLPREPSFKLITIGFLWFLPWISPSPAASVKDVNVLECSKPKQHLLEVSVAEPGLPQPDARRGHPGAVLGTHQGPGETGRLRGFSVGWHSPWLPLKLSGSSGAVPRTSGCVLPRGVWDLPRPGRRDLRPGAHLSTRRLTEQNAHHLPAASSGAWRRNRPLLSALYMMKRRTALFCRANVKTQPGYPAKYLHLHPC